MNVNFSNINLNTIIMFALAILLAYLGIAVFKIIGRILSITIGIFLLTYVLQQVGITIPILSDILSALLQLLKPIIDIITNLFSSSSVKIK
jgi:phage-related protein